MAKKIYIIENLDCANCAAKIEAKFNALPEVEEATISFPTRQLHLTAEDPDGLIDKLTAIARTVESEVEIHPRDTHSHGHHHEGCACGHDHHDHDHDCGCGHHHDHEEHHHNHEEHHHTHEHDGEGESLTGILIGAALFVLGLLLQKVTVLGIPSPPSSSLVLT